MCEKRILGYFLLRLACVTSTYYFYDRKFTLISSFVHAFNSSWGRGGVLFEFNGIYVYRDIWEVSGREVAFCLKKKEQIKKYDTHNIV